MPGKRRARVVPERFGLRVSRARIQRQRFGLVQPGFEPQPCRPESPRLVFRLLEPRAGDASTTGCGSDVHALQLTTLWLDEPHATTRDRLTGVPPRGQAALCRG